MKSDLRSVKSFLVTSKGDVVRIGTDKTSINAANLVKSYSDFVVDCPVTAEAQKVARSHGLPEFNLCVSASSGKYKGFIRLIAGKTSYGFDLKASNKHTAMKQIEAVFDDIFSGNVISEFEFYDKSVLHASANSHVSVYDTFVPQVGRGKAAFYADRFKRMGSKGSNTQVCYYAKVCASKEADVVVDYPKRVSVAHTFVNASGMSRVVQHLNKALTGEGAVAIFTAFQKMGKGSTIDLEKNEKNYRELGRILDNLQNGAIPMDGYWQGTAEKSYLVPNLSLELAKALNARYHQWAFIYAGPETAGKFEFYATPDNYGTKEDYVVSATWDNYAVEGLKDPQGYSKVDDRKFSFYEGGDTPEEYMNAVMDLNKWANNVIDSVKVSYTEKDRENRIKEKRDKMKDMVAARKRKAGTDIISDSDRPKTSPAFYKVWKLGVSQEEPEVLFNKISRKKWQEYIKENRLNFVPEDSPTALASGHFNDKEGNAFFIGYPDQESPMGVTSAVDTYYFPAEKATDKVVSRTESLGSGFYFCKDKQEALDLFGARKRIKSGLYNDLVRLRDTLTDPDLIKHANILLDQYVTPAGSRVVGPEIENFIAEHGTKGFTSVKASRQLTSAFGKKAYWISPSGEVIDCATTHISEVINKPEQFGLTREGIEGLYKQHDEPLGHEGKAREEIMLDLIKKGWTRIRWVPSKYSWTVQIADLTKRVMDNLQNWAMSIITSDEGLKNTDVIILPVNEGVPQSFHPLKDIAADVLYRTVEASKEPESVYVKNLRDKGVAKATWFEDQGQYYVKFSDGSDGYFKKEDLDFSTDSVKASKTEAPEEMVQGYKEALIWTEEGAWEEQVGGIDKVTIDAFTEESDKVIKADVNKFYSENLDLIQKFIDETDTDYAQVGHSLWLTRQLFGAGFADFKGDASQELHEKALKMGDVNVEYGSDDKIHVQGRKIVSSSENIIRDSIKISDSDLEGEEFTAYMDKSPLPTDVIPNNMGINLCNVESISWEKLPDGQLVSLSIQFLPDMSGMFKAESSTKPKRRTASKLPSFKVTFENGDTLVTSMAAGITLEDAKKYYIGRSFTFGTGEEGNPERQVKAVDVEQIGFASEASKIPTTLEEVKQAYGEVPANVKFEFGDTLKVYFNGTAEDTVSYVDKIKKDLGDNVVVTNKPKGFFTKGAKDGDLVLEKIDTKEGFDYYIGIDTDGSYVYNVVREGIPAPKTGYYRSQYICDLRGVPNIFDEFEKEGTRTEDTISDPRQ